MSCVTAKCTQNSIVAHVYPVHDSMGQTLNNLKKLKMRKSLVLKNNVVKYRKKLKLTQNELAALVGVSPQTIKALEKRPPKYSPSIATLEKLSKIFKCDANKLIYF